MSLVKFEPSLIAKRTPLQRRLRDHEREVRLRHVGVERAIIERVNTLASRVEAARTFRRIEESLYDAVAEAIEDGDPAPSDEALKVALSLARALTKRIVFDGFRSHSPRPKFSASVDYQRRISLTAQYLSGQRLTLLLSPEASEFKLIHVYDSGDVRSQVVQLRR